MGEVITLKQPWEEVEFADGLFDIIPDEYKEPFEMKCRKEALYYYFIYGSDLIEYKPYSKDKLKRAKEEIKE